MKIICRLGVLVCLLLVNVFNVKAAEPACEAQPVHENGTTIATPAPNAVVTSPFTLSGMYSSPFEANVPTRILDASGNTLLEPIVTALGSEGLQPYEETIHFNVSAPTPACIVVYFEDIAEGGLTPLVQVPVTLAPSTTLPGTGASADMLPWIMMLVPVLLGGGFVLRKSVNRRGV